MRRFAVICFSLSLLWILILGVLLIFIAKYKPVNQPTTNAWTKDMGNKEIVCNKAIDEGQTLPECQE